MLRAYRTEAFSDSGCLAPENNTNSAATAGLIQKIQDNLHFQASTTKDWQDAWSLLLGQDPQGTKGAYAKRERQLLAKELARQ